MASTPRDWELERERTLGELVEAAKQARTDRAEIKRELEKQTLKFEQQDHRCDLILQKISDQHAEHLIIESELKKALNLSARLLLVEAQLGKFGADTQAIFSVASLIRKYSIRVLFSVLIAIIAGLSAGVVGMGKITSLLIQWFTMK